MISGSDAASIFMEPIHLSSAIAAKKIIKEGETRDQGTQQWRKRKQKLFNFACRWDILPLCDNSEPATVLSLISFSCIQ